MGPIGFPGLILIPMFLLTSVVPLVLGIWVVVTLHRIRTTLESIEKLLQRA